MNIDKRAFDVLTEAYETFSIEGPNGDPVQLHLYPFQLGRLALISKRLLDLDIAVSEDPENEVKKMWEICSEKPRQVAEIIAIATLRNKAEIDSLFEERTQLILDSPSMVPKTLSQLLMTIVFQSFHVDFMKAIRLVKTLQVSLTQTQE
jgi:hypothetical protein